MIFNFTEILLKFAVFCILLSGSKDSEFFDDDPPATNTAWTGSWSYDDKLIAVGNSNGELAVYETSGWKKIKSWQYNNTTITRVEWNPKFRILAVAAYSPGGSTSAVQLFDFDKNEILKILPDSVQGRGVSWSPTGEEVAFVGSRGRISIYSKEGKYRKTLSFENSRSLFDIDWHPTKNLLLAVEDDIYLIDIDSDSLLAKIDDGSINKAILCCQWHTSGNFFVTGDYGHENEGAEPSYLKLWSKEGKLMKRIKESYFEYRNIKWRRDGKLLAAATDMLLVFNERGELVSKTKFDDNNLWGVEWSYSGDKILTTDQVGHVRITNTSGKALVNFTF
jgi:WD40 repeat protein